MYVITAQQGKTAALNRLAGNHATIVYQDPKGDLHQGTLSHAGEEYIFTGDDGELDIFCQDAVNAVIENWLETRVCRKPLERVCSYTQVPRDPLSSSWHFEPILQKGDCGRLYEHRR